MNQEFKNKPDEIELCYGIVDGEIVHLSEIASGVSPNCLCPKCGSILIAKKGDIRRHHFAHYNYENCHGSQETALHLLAKEILCQEKQLTLPKFNNEQLPEIKSFSNVDLEVRELGLVFDALGTTKKERLAIEIKVTHGIDDRKRQIVINNNIQMIEIDLSNYLNENATKPIIKEAVINSAPRVWINQNVPNNLIKEKNMLNTVTIAGFKFDNGFSRKNNSAFKRDKLFILKKIEHKSSANYQVSAFGGFEAESIDVIEKAELIEKLSQFSFPIEAVVTIELDQQNKFKPVVTDVNLV
jgi:ssDNA-binding Zn-finger/Zn-ribbon topoisomerase 1